VFVTRSIAYSGIGRRRWSSSNFPPGPRRLRAGHTSDDDRPFLVRVGARRFSTISPVGSGDSGVVDEGGQLSNVLYRRWVRRVDRGIWGVTQVLPEASPGQGAPPRSRTLRRTASRGGGGQNREPRESHRGKSTSLPLKPGDLLGPEELRFTSKSNRGKGGLCEKANSLPLRIGFEPIYRFVDRPLLTRLGPNLRCGFRRLNRNHRNASQPVVLYPLLACAAGWRRFQNGGDAFCDGWM
jgi:hypothetical protein